MPAPISRTRSKGANEFGITKTMTPAALLAFISDIHSLTLQTAQGLYLTTGWYWDLNEETRAFGKRFFAKMKKEPTMDQAGYYSATMQYLKAVKTVGSTDSDKVMAELKKAKINDMFTKNGYVRADGLMVHTMYVMQVKTPSRVEVSLGLLQGDQGHAGRRGRRVAAGSDLSAGQEVACSRDDVTVPCSACRCPRSSASSCWGW